VRKSKVDIAQIAREALAGADRLVPQWLPGGHRTGGEWKAPNPTRRDDHVGSFSINLRTGVWADFACDDKGGDLVSLYAYLFGVNQLEAARQVADIIGINVDAPAAPEPKPTKARTEWVPVVPVPDTAPEPPVAHVARGRPQATWAYRGLGGELLGYVYRFATSDGGKEILPVVWARHPKQDQTEWRWMQWPEPRPMYGLDRLQADKPILIVEGEKCADAGHALLAEHFCVVSWPGGGQAVGKVDWSPLAARKVLIWPDCDAQRDKEAQELLPAEKQPGIVTAERIAAALLELGAKVRIVAIPAPGEKPPGWDVADAIADGWGAGEIRMLLNMQRSPAAAKKEPAPKPAARRDEDWAAKLLYRKGECAPCLANIVLILAHHPEWAGVIGFDEFQMRVLKRQPVPGARLADLGEWTDADTTAVRIWLTHEYQLVAGPQDVDAAVELVAQMNGFHPVREYLGGLKWDGQPRLDEWLSDYMGVERSDYTALVGRWFLMAMAARVHRPGCKFDYCLVLEGSQGLRKSTALRVLAGEFFSDTELDLTNKDAMSSIRGKWLHEFAEMGSLARAENTRQKSFLSRQVDEFRPTYARREIRCPRQLVFAGTTNDWMWNKDATGGRRFWPIEVRGEIDTDGLAQARDQLLAEADHRFRAGERYWPLADEQRALFDPQQLQREGEDGLFDMLHDWIEHLTKPEFTMGEILSDALKLDAGRITRDVTTRVGTLLKKLGCGRKEKRNGVSRFVYTLPEWSDFRKHEAQRAAGDGGRDGSSLPI
jgi:putative DNA primase/helicase